MKRGTVLFLVGLGVIVLVATVVSQFASGDPDGLEYVAEQEGFADTAEEHGLSEAPLADYETEGGGIGGRALAGLVGVVVTLAIGAGLFWIVRADQPGRGETAET